MRIIIGIGNPGRRYAFTRHNAGFMLLDYIAEKKSLNFSPGNGDYYFAETNFNSNIVLLVKPTTFVNNSGLAALQLLEDNNLSPEDLLVVHDDINLETARIRVRTSGGDGGHNGISSIIYHLASGNFPRIRIGIGSNFLKGEMAEYVLSGFAEEEFELLKKTFNEAELLIGEFAANGLNKLMDANSKLSNK